MVPWGKKIASYLWTKSISAGVLLLSALFLNMGFAQDGVVLSLIGPAGLLAVSRRDHAIVGFRPQKTRPLFLSHDQTQFQFLVDAGRLCADGFSDYYWRLWLGQMYRQGFVSVWLIWLTALFAIASAGYSAFLFAQARGRDFWQSPIAVLAFDRSSDRRRRRCVDLDRRPGIHHALSIHERRALCLVGARPRHCRCWRAWR